MIKEKYPGEEFTRGADCNSGLISFIEKDMKETRCQAAGTVVYDIETGNIKFDVIGTPTRKELKENYDEDFDELPVCDEELDRIALNNICGVIKT